MTLTGTGFALILIGVVVAWGNAGILPRGLRDFRGLLAEYRAAKAAGREPSLDARGAHAKSIGYAIGGVITVFGALIAIVGFLFER